MAPPLHAAPRTRTALVAAVVFGVAFGWLEAAVVVYLRRLFYPGGFSFPLVLGPTDIAVVELAREAATLVMLGAFAWAGARTAWGRFGLFAVAFGTWDLVYYLGLKLALDWPATLGDWDVLFLIPAIWTGPVWSPALIAALLVACGAALHARGERGLVPRPRARHWLLAVASLAAILAAFLANHGRVYAGGMPERFPWALFLAGVGLGLAAFGDLVRRPVSPGR